MAYIKVHIREDEHNKIRYYRNFEILEDLPECEKVKEAILDCEQGNNEVNKYYFFECIFEDDQRGYYAISKYLEKDISIKSYPANIDVFISDKNHFTGEMESKCFSMNIDGLEFDDDIELKDFINDWIIDNIDNWFCLNENDINKIIEKISILLYSKIVESEE